MFDLTTIQVRNVRQKINNELKKMSDNISASVSTESVIAHLKTGAASNKENVIDFLDKICKER